MIATNFNPLEKRGILDWLLTGTPLNPDAEQRRWERIRHFLDLWEQPRRIENILTLPQRITLIDFVSELQLHRKKLVTSITKKVQEQITLWSCTKHGLECRPWIHVVCNNCLDSWWRATRVNERERQLICSACLHRVLHQLTLGKCFSDFLGISLRHKDGSLDAAV